MGLAVEVNVFSDLIDNDPEGVLWLRESFAKVNALLAENGLPPHHEPENMPPLVNRQVLGSFPYSFLHQLRRIAAHADEYPGWVAVPFPEFDDPASDPLVEKHTARMESHLLCHSDCEGFYIPIPFTEILFDHSEEPIPGEYLGSSFVLLEELCDVARSLRIALQGTDLSDEEALKIHDAAETESPLWIEKAVWLTMFEAARLSIQHNTAIVFS
jgi:hypothetical protein